MSKLHNFKYKFRYYNNKMDLGVTVDDETVITIFEKIKKDTVDLRCIPTVMGCLINEKLKQEGLLVVQRKTFITVIEQTIRHICGTNDFENINNFFIYFADFNQWDYKNNNTVHDFILPLLKSFGHIYVTDVKAKFN